MKYVPTISIIVPVYNAEKYLSGCLTSILEQTFRDFELIIVNDGSVDGSGAIVDRFAALDSRISVIHQANSGVTAARKNGIAKACGSYIFFVDADDTIPRNALEIFTPYLNKDWDIIDGQWEDLTSIRKNESLHINEYRSRLVFAKTRIGACGKMIKRALFTPSTLNLPRDIRVGEDWIMQLRLAFNTENPVLVIPNQVYCYNLNETSVTTSFKHNINYARTFYPHLIDSVPPALSSEYVPLITNVVIKRWVFYTSGMIRLTQFASDFHDELKLNYRKGFPGLGVFDYLLFCNPNLVLRTLFLGFYHVQNILFPLLRKTIRRCRTYKNLLFHR